MNIYYVTNAGITVYLLLTEARLNSENGQIYVLYCGKTLEFDELR